MPHLAKRGGWKVRRIAQRKVMGIYLIPIKWCKEYKPAFPMAANQRKMPIIFA